MAYKWVKKEVNRQKNDSQSVAYSTKQKFNAVLTYLSCGTLTGTAAATGISLRTLTYWKATDWWKKFEEEIRISKNIKKSNKLEKVVEKAIDQLEDRLDNGDIHLDYKTQQPKRVPVSAKTLNTIIKDGLDKQALLDRMNANIETPTVTNQDILQRLDVMKDYMRKMAFEKNKRDAKDFVETPDYEIQRISGTVAREIEGQDGAILGEAEEVNAASPGGEGVTDAQQ